MGEFMMLMIVLALIILTLTVLAFVGSRMNYLVYDFEELDGGEKP